MKLPLIQATRLFLIKRFTLSVVLIVSLTLCSCAATDTNTKSLFQINRPDNPNGAPTLVLQAGLGDDSATWKNILPLLTEQYRVFMVNRPGSGHVPNMAGARDPCTIAQEQHQLLASEGIAPPYVLVGHSLGGLYQYAFLRLYPNDVAGIVLIDPTHPRNWQEIQKQFPASANLVKGMKTFVFSATQRREFEDQTRCLDRPEFTNPAPQKPGIILIAGRSRSNDPAGYGAMHLALARDWPALMDGAKLEIVWDSAHYIHQEQSVRVINAIRSVASPDQCSKGCATLNKSLNNIEIGGTKAFDIVFGKTKRGDIESVVGVPSESCITPFGEHGLVCFYRTKPEAAPIWLSLVPVVGDIVDVSEMVTDSKKWRELVVEYDERSIVKRAGIRAIH